MDRELPDLAPAPQYDAPTYAPTYQGDASGWQVVKSQFNTHKPCHGTKPADHAGPSTYFPGPIGALLSRLGFTPRERGHRSHVQLEVVSALKDEVNAHRHMEAFKEQVEEMIHRVEAETVPLMEGGMVKILPIFNELGDIASPEQVGKAHEAQTNHHFRIGHAGHGEPIDEDEIRMIRWESMAGKDGIKAVHHKHGVHGHEHRHGPHGHHGWRGKSFGCR